MGGFSQGFSYGGQLAEQDIAHKRELQDEQRKTTLKTLLEDAETPADKVAAIQAVYHQDPSVLKQHVENLTRRITGKKPQDVVSPDQAQASRIAPIAARGKLPEQQQSERALADYKSMAGAQQEAGDAATNHAMQVYDQKFPNATPEEKQRYFEALNGVKNYRPTASDQSRADYQAAIAGGQIKPDADGNIPSFEAWKANQAAVGRVSGTPPKPKNPLQMYVDLTAKKMLAESKKGPPLTDQESADLAASGQGLTLAAKARADEMAKAQAIYNVIPVYNPDTGSEDLRTRAQAAAAANTGNPMQPGIIGAPTGMDKKNQMLAQSAVQQIDTMESILDSDPGLTGPGQGQWQAFQRWLGSNSEDSQAFLAANLLAAEHGVGVFGGRNIHSINDLQNAMGALRTNPKALKAGLEQMKKTFSLWTNASGRLPAPRGAGGAAPIIVQHSKSTNQYRYSLDGGRTWKPGQPPQQ